ncbi:MAG: class I SAM-dependent DNA methyltransferase [Polyangiaceae bacterium]|jgi:type I restriction enzyme M protein
MSAPSLARKPISDSAGRHFEERLWQAAEALRGHVEPAEYKHIVLAMLFLRHVTDVDLLRPGEVAPFVVPPSARWGVLRNAAAAERRGAAFGSAVSSLEIANESLRGLFAFDIARLDADRAIQLVESMSAIPPNTANASTRDVLGRVYEYFLAHFASSEGRSGGEYYTPRSVVDLLVEMVQPFAGTLYDPCCGTGGMFVQSEAFLLRHGSRPDDLEIIGQESSPTTWRLAKMNLTLRGMKADLGSRPADTFRCDLHEGRRADFVLANPPFNARDGGLDRLAGDPRWLFGVPPRNSANFAWLQHIFSHLKPDGVAGVVLANGSLSSDQAGEGDLRRKMVEADVVECVVALPSRLFYGTSIPACLWLLSPSKTRAGAGHLARQTLFVDARDRGRTVDRAHADLGPDDLTAIACAYRDWRAVDRRFARIDGFARSASTEEIRRHRYALVPGRYVGFARRDERGDACRRALQAELQPLRARLTDIDAASSRIRRALEALSRG